MYSTCMCVRCSIQGIQLPSMRIKYMYVHTYLREVWLGVCLLPPSDSIWVFGCGWKAVLGGRGGDRVPGET